MSSTTEVLEATRKTEFEARVYNILADFKSEDVAWVRKRLFDEAEMAKHMLPYNDEHKFAREWYIRMPDMKAPTFPSFMVSSRELAIYVSDKEDIEIRVSDESTAYADQEKGHIVMPKHLASPKAMLKRDFDDLTSAIVSATNGVLLHEAAHFAKSEKTMLAVLRKAFPSIADKSKFTAVMALIANVVEDVYIEDWLRTAYHGYSNFVAASHEFYFNENELLRRITDLLTDIHIEERNVSKDKKGKIETIIHRSVEMDRLLDLLIAITKCWRYQSTMWEPLIKKYVDMFHEAKGMESSDDRTALIKRIHDALYKDPEIWSPPAAMVPSITISINFDDDGMSISIDQETLEALGEESLEAAEELIAGLISRAIKDDETIRKIREGKARAELGSHIPETILRPMRQSGTQVKPDPRFASLGRALRRTFTTNYAPGQPMKRGQVIVGTRLYRIATDGKIFSQREKRQATGRDYEIGVLVDISGSMNGAKINEAMAVGAAAWSSLKQAGTRTFLVAHTGTDPHAGSEAPIVYLIGEYGDPIPRVFRRAQFPLDGNGILKNNYDGFALLKAAELFSDKRTKKWLFHISDGAPSGLGYGGEPAQRHTQGAVALIRRKGIDVVSITIASGAYGVNDRIYGREKNVKTTSSRVLADLISAMFITKTKRSS